jgi:hypothetical protein
MSMRSLRFLLYVSGESIDIIRKISIIKITLKDYAKSVWSKVKKFIFSSATVT